MCNFCFVYNFCCYAVKLFCPFNHVKYYVLRDVNAKIQLEIWFVSLQPAIVDVNACSQVEHAAMACDVEPDAFVDSLLLSMAYVLQTEELGRQFPQIDITFLIIPSSIV